MRKYLIDGISGPLIPVLINALLWRDDVNELAQIVGKESSPAQVDMPVERHRFVLGQDQNLFQTAVQAIRQGKVDDAI